MTATLTRPATAPAPAVDEHALWVAAVRILLAAGWRKTWNPNELSSTGDFWDGVRLSWDDALYPDGARLVWLTERHPGRGERTDEFHAASVQQAVDVLSALTGLGVHLTTGARRWGR